MKKLFLLFLITLLFALNVNAQSPLTFETFVERGDFVSVEISDTISITFDAPIDTVDNFRLGETFFTNLGEDAEFWFSEDLTTVYFVPVYQADTYYYLVHLGLKLADGTRQSKLLHLEFATSDSYAGVIVSGTVLFQEGLTPAVNTLVGLFNGRVDDEGTYPVHVTLTDSLGNYFINGVANGTYFPVAVKDFNEDGRIDPEHGDLIAKGDSIVVTGGDVDEIDLLLKEVIRVRFDRAKALVDSIKSGVLFNSLKLYYVTAWGVDSLARASEWEFLFLNTFTPQLWRVEVNPDGYKFEQMDQNFFNWIRNFRALGDSLSVASLPDSFLINIEQRVGRVLRSRTLPDSLQLEVRLSLGDVTRDGFRDVVPDTSRFYWGLRYGFYNKNQQDGGGDEGTSLAKTAEVSSEFNDQLFLADYKTGEEVAVTGVTRNNNSIPQEYLLEQNYPNPFNPSTKIRYSIPSNEFVTLKIYNILGSEVATLVNQKQASGSYEVSFNATDLTSGIYFYQISTSNFTQVNKMMLVK